MLGCAISPDGTFVATCSYDDSLCFTNIATKATVYTAHCDRDVRARLSSFVSDHHDSCKVWGVAWSPDGTRLVAVTASGSVIQVTKNYAHPTVYKIDEAVWITFVALAKSLLIP